MTLDEFKALRPGQIISYSAPHIYAILQIEEAYAHGIWSIYLVGSSVESGYWTVGKSCFWVTQTDAQYCEVVE